MDHTSSSGRGHDPTPLQQHEQGGPEATGVPAEASEYVIDGASMTLTQAIAQVMETIGLHWADAFLGIVFIEPGGTQVFGGEQSTVVVGRRAKRRAVVRAERMTGPMRGVVNRAVGAAGEVRSTGSPAQNALCAAGLATVAAGRLRLTTAAIERVGISSTDPVSQVVYKVTALRRAGASRVRAARMAGSNPWAEAVIANVYAG